MRRRRASAEGGDYDSVLDTMTNVVGILVIVVAVTQLNVSSAVGRARDALIASGDFHEHAPVSDTVLDAARRKRDALRAQREVLESEKGDAEDAAGTGEVVSDEEWADLERRLKESNLGPKPEDLEARIRMLEAQLRLLKAEIEDLEEQIRRTSERIQELKRELEAIEKRKLEEPPPMRVRIPDPDASRTIGREQRTFVVRHGRIYELDVDALFKKLVADNEKDWEAMPSYLKTVEDQRRWICRRWQARGYQNRLWKLEFAMVRNALAPGGWDIQITRTIRSISRGIPLTAATAHASRFGRQARSMDKRKEWFFFHVYDDSFEAYLAARMVVEELGFPAGWLAWARTEALTSFAFNGRATAKAKAD